MSAELNNVPEKLMRLFNRYPDVTAEELARVYANSVVFEDPVVRLTGLDKVSNYFRKMYRGVISCEFNYRDVVAGGDQLDDEPAPSGAQARQTGCRERLLGYPFRQQSLLSP